MNRLVSGVALRIESEEGAQVEVAFEIDRQVVDLDAERGGVGCVADGEAVAERTQQLFDGVGRGVTAAEGGRFVGWSRRELPNRRLGAESLLPGDRGTPGGGGDLRFALDLAGQPGDRFDVDGIEPGDWWSC